MWLPGMLGCRRQQCERCPWDGGGGPASVISILQTEKVTPDRITCVTTPHGHSLWASNSRNPEQDFDSPSPALWDNPFTESKRRVQRGQTPRYGSWQVGKRSQRPAGQGESHVLCRRSPFQKAARCRDSDTTSPLEASTSLSLGEKSIRMPWAEERFSRGWRRQWHPTPVLLPGKSHG